MNHKSNNESIKLPKHIDPREFVPSEPTAEIITMSFMMEDSKTTPYRYIRRALGLLVKGNYDEANICLDYASKFCGVFWPEGSKDNEAYKLTIQSMRIQFYFLPEKFRELKPEKDLEE
ncbi:MAG: hypothetical protein CVV49_08975 [Spirochaetae bacterium HGW-Spirochaetae-5]|nr:MAG: hypothetical protein CVV49_08975 [Spirochaetae bacterium HGW-Spirochaetae-5]